MKESYFLLQFCLTHQADGKDMKDCRVALQVLLSVVRFERNTYGFFNCHNHSSLDHVPDSSCGLLLIKEVIVHLKILVPQLM